MNDIAYWCCSPVWTPRLTTREPPDFRLPTWWLEPTTASRSGGTTMTRKRRRPRRAAPGHDRATSETSRPAGHRPRPSRPADTAPAVTTTPSVLPWLLAAIPTTGTATIISLTGPTRRRRRGSDCRRARTSTERRCGLARMASGMRRRPTMEKQLENQRHSHRSVLSVSSPVLCP